MCGILAVYSKNNKLDSEKCYKALDMLSQRGPDFNFSNIYQNGSLFFGQTVLSITGNPQKNIDSYHQSTNGRYDLVLNGEVYNHKELYQKYIEGQMNIKTDCDTETLVNLHQKLSEVEVYNSLRGMFAYLIYDSLSETLIIGRDIIGEKILYYYEDDNYLVISSEIGPILEIIPSIRINKDILKEYFFTRHLLSPINTSFEGIKLIQPGHLVKYDLKSKNFENILIRKPADLIDPDVIENNKIKTKEILTDELESLFIKTAKFLSPSIDYYSVFSGGIDSSLASYFLQKYNPPKSLITLQFPGKDNTNLNMTEFEKIIGRNIETLEVNKNIFSEFFPKSYKAACGPLSTHSFVSQAIMSKHVKNNNIKVLIGGDGADELFGGYEFYKTFKNKFNSYPKKNPSAYSGFINNSEISFNGWSSNNFENRINEVWSEHSNYYYFENDYFERMIQTVLYSDTIIQLESVGIRAADTMSMLNSVESRSFFLNHDIIEFALNLPASFKIDLFNNHSIMQTKPLLKELYKRKFGENLIFEKQGFSGYPNEAAKLMVNDDFQLLDSVLKIKYTNPSRAQEWKMLNVQIFLSTFNNFL